MLFRNASEIGMRYYYLELERRKKYIFSIVTYKTKILIRKDITKKNYYSVIDKYVVTLYALLSYFTSEDYTDASGKD